MGSHLDTGNTELLGESLLELGGKEIEGGREREYCDWDLGFALKEKML
jgi:hypothetical protein